MGTQEIVHTYERGPFFVGSLGSLCRYKIFLSCLGCSSRPSTKDFFLHCKPFYCICPHPPSKLHGQGQSCRIAFLCLWVELTFGDIKNLLSVEKITPCCCRFNTTFNVNFGCASYTYTSFHCSNPSQPVAFLTNPG
jgi:hypothetical protein